MKSSKSILRRLFSNPSPFIPLPLMKGEREEILERGAAPLLLLLPLPLSRGGGVGGWVVKQLHTLGRLKEWVGKCIL
jgi:hypothetical protein